MDQLITLCVGCTGLVGKSFISHMVAQASPVRVVVRSQTPSWLDELAKAHDFVETIQCDGGKTPLPLSHLDGCSAVVNLAGAPIADGRWTDSRKDVLRSSRVDTTESIARAIAQAPHVGVLINASGVSIYGLSGGVANEDSPTKGDHFLAELAIDWENAASSLNHIDHCRLVCLRIGVVLSGEGGPLEKMIPGWLPRFAPLVPLAGGKQGMPWTHVDDVVAMISTAITDERWTGPVNAVAPEQVTNAEFMRIAAKQSGHCYCPAGPPAWLLHTMLGELAIVVTGDMQVEAKRAKEWGYEWHHPTVSQTWQRVAMLKGVDEETPPDTGWCPSRWLGFP